MARCFNASRLSMFMISLFANRFCDMFNPSTHLPLNSWIHPLLYSLFLLLSKFRSIFGGLLYSKKGLSIFLSLIQSFIFHPFWLRSGLRNQWRLFSYANNCIFRFKWYWGWAIVLNKRIPVQKSTLLKMSGSVSIMSCSTG